MRGSIESKLFEEENNVGYRFSRTAEAQRAPCKVAMLGAGFRRLSTADLVSRDFNFD